MNIHTFIKLLKCSNKTVHINFLSIFIKKSKKIQQQ